VIEYSGRYSGDVTQRLDGLIRGSSLNFPQGGKIRSLETPTVNIGGSVVKVGDGMKLASGICLEFDARAANRREAQCLTRLKRLRPNILNRIGATQRVPAASLRQQFDKERDNWRG
jgi:hypothetical protein